MRLITVSPAEVEACKSSGNHSCRPLHVADQRRQTPLRVANFSLPVPLDPSQKVVNRMGHGRRLLRPIYQIQTTDIFAQMDEPEEDGSASAALQLFCFGRPLWGGRFC